MKFLLILSVTFLMVSCKQVLGVKGKVLRDCTGTYIQIDGKDFLVCNINKLDNFNNGDSILVRFKQSTYCPESDTLIVCMMYHQNEGLIRIVKASKYQ